MDQLRKKGKKCVRLLRRIYIGYGLVHIARPLALLCYSFAGAAVFLFFEKQAEIDRGLDRRENLREMRRRIIATMLNNVFNDTENFLLFIDGPQTQLIAGLYDQAFNRYENVVLLANSKFDGTRRMHWDLGNALVYSWTVITTIGYGHLCPSTVGGRVATMIYAIFGIPLMLSVLTDVGKLLTKFMKYPFLLAKMGGRRIFQYCTQMTREQIQAADDKDKSTLEIFDLPIPIAICTVVIWIFICSAITLVWEQEWDYLVAFYFFFISLSTIGFGDVIPSDTRYLFLLFGNIMIGLALVSMCINLMQSKLEKINAEAAAVAAAAAAANSPSESTNRLDGLERRRNPSWRGIGPKDTIVEIEDSSNKADESSSYRLHVRRPSPAAAVASQTINIIGQAFGLKRILKSKIDENIECFGGEKLVDVEIENKEVVEKPVPATICISQHSFPAADCKIRSEAVDIPYIDQPNKQDLNDQFDSDNQKCTDRLLHHQNKVTHFRRKINSHTISNMTTTIHKKAIISEADTNIENDYEEYLRVLTKRELLEQILHENALTKLKL